MDDSLFVKLKRSPSAMDAADLPDTAENPISQANSPIGKRASMLSGFQVIKPPNRRPPARRSIKERNICTSHAERSVRRCEPHWPVPGDSIRTTWSLAEFYRLADNARGFGSLLEQSPLRGFLPVNPCVLPLLMKLLEEPKPKLEPYAFFQQYEFIRGVEFRLFAELKGLLGPDFDVASPPALTRTLTPPVGLSGMGPSHGRLTSTVIQSSWFCMWSPEIDEAFIKWTLRMSSEDRNFAWQHFGIPTEPRLPPDPTCSSPFPLEIQVTA